uniref:Secreted protein n=1 Tax=Opuntia streptacantha TaxID=393608 RepID=A0A7C9AY45_OPUST
MTFRPNFFILLANSKALAQCSFILRPKWGILSESSKATFAFIVGPNSIRAPWCRSIIEFTRLAGPQTAPAMISAPPLMNLEMLCTTTSAPSLAGEMTMGAKVLSTTTITPLSWAIRHSSGMSATVRVGFDIASK